MFKEFKYLLIILLISQTLLYANTYYETIRIPLNVKLEDISNYKNNSKYLPNFIEKEGEVVFVADTLDGVDAYYNGKTDGHGNGDYTFYQCTEYVGRYYFNKYKKYFLHTGYKQKINLNSLSNQGMIGDYLHSGMTFNYGGIPTIYVGKHIAFTLEKFTKNINKGYLYKKDSGFGHVAIVKEKAKIVYLKQENKTNQYFYSKSKKDGYSRFYQINLIEENKLPYKSCKNSAGCKIPKRAIFIKVGYSETGYFSTFYTENISELNTGKTTLKNGSGIRFFKPPSIKDVVKNAIDKMEFIKDVTVIESGTYVNNTYKSYTKFMKVWRVKNIGFKVWTKYSYILSKSMGITKKQFLPKNIQPNEEVDIAIEFNPNYEFGEKQKYNFYLYNNDVKVINGYINTTFYMQSIKCFNSPDGCIDSSYTKYEHLPYPDLTKEEARKLLIKYFHADVLGLNFYKNINNTKILNRYQATILLFEVAKFRNKAYVDDTIYGVQIGEDKITFNKSILKNIEDLMYANAIKKNIKLSNLNSNIYAQKFVLGSFLFPIMQKDDGFYWSKKMRYLDFKYAVERLKERMK